MNITEAEMTISGVPLTTGQSMTVRVALELFAMDIKNWSKDESDCALHREYSLAINEIRKLISIDRPVSNG